MTVCFHEMALSISYQNIVSLISWLLEQGDFVFQWDQGNREKSLLKHRVFCDEVESVFLYPHQILLLGEQTAPVVNETRFGAVGKTHTERLVFLCFVVRDSQIRIVSVRQANKKEIAFYEIFSKTRSTI